MDPDIPPRAMWASTPELRECECPTCGLLVHSLILALCEGALNKMKRSLTTRPESPLRFPFQRLPSEIRNKIYRLHLVQTGRTTLVHSSSRSLDRHIARAARWTVKDPEYEPQHYKYTVLSIFQVSRQLHEEATWIFYYYNCLQLYSVTCLGRFLQSIGPKRRSYIRSLSFNFHGFGTPAAFSLLATCERLTQLHINISHLTILHSRNRPSPLLNAWGMKHLLKLRGLRSLEFSGLCDLPDEIETTGFEEIVRSALLQPRKITQGMNQHGMKTRSKKRAAEGEEDEECKKTKLSKSRKRSKK